MATEYQKLSEEIDKLEKNVLELKKKRARCSSYPPIKITKGQTTLKLKTERGSDWTFEEIKYEKHDRYNYAATVTCEKCFSKRVKVDLDVNDNMEVCYMSVRVSPDDTFTWNDRDESYTRCFYDGMFDTDRVISVRFEKL